MGQERGETGVVNKEGGREGGKEQNGIVFAMCGLRFWGVGEPNKRRKTRGKLDPPSRYMYGKTLRQLGSSNVLTITMNFSRLLEGG